MASLLSVLSLNTNKRTDLEGLHSIFKETKPHLGFLQEVVSDNAGGHLLLHPHSLHPPASLQRPHPGHSVPPTYHCRKSGLGESSW
jgi:hypothetical protein